MNDIEDVTQAICIVLLVADFLLNTGRALKAIEICKECSIFLSNEALKKEEQIVNLFTTAISLRMFKAYSIIPDYTNAIRYGKELLVIYRECGKTAEEGIITMELAIIHERRCEYAEARELCERAINIMKETGDKQGEAVAYEKVGIMSYYLGQYVKAKENLRRALAISIEIGDRREEGSCYGNFGTVFRSIGEYGKAREYLKKSLAIRIGVGDKEGEATDYGNLGTVFQSVGEYEKAREYHEKALAIRIEIGDKQGEAADYGNLGVLFGSLGEYDKAREYLEKALANRIEIGDRAGEALDYGRLGTVFQSHGEYDKAKEYYEKALAIRLEIGDRSGKAADYGNLGVLFGSLGDYNKARECLKKALAINIKIGDREGEAVDYGNLGALFHYQGEHDIAEGYLEKALSISKDIGDCAKEFEWLSYLAMVKFSQRKIKESHNHLLLSINKSENLRGFLKDNDQFKISFSDVQNSSFRFLCACFCFSGNPNNALYVEELARARALADLMATQYSVKSEISANPQSWIGIENIMKRESNCICLYIFYHDQHVFLWILKTSGVICYRRITVNENIFGAGLVGSLTEFFDKNFRSFGILPEESCEDRSVNVIEPKLKSFQEESLAALRLVEEDDGERQNPESSNSLCYRMLIAPVADLLEEPEIIIVPDRSLNKVPFAALSDEGGKYLSETFRIRIVPSLSTLKLIQDSPADYHSQTGALIVGDPVVGRVRYMGRVQNFKPLPCARKEAEMIGEMLSVQPLLGQCATKQAVLERLHSVSLIHFAAHGNAERGEIALSPLRLTNRIPQEDDYLLTMSDISQVQLRAKLVVLSCCHSACGQIRAEGVVGIARAFLGSGARSVLVALWAIEDRATKELMRRFYEHLVRGESASESLHEAMKWMRGNGFTKVSEWAPFMLIGDNVTFKFGK
ncbi:tetratricopeptide repeat protein 28-like [Oculina patagonica]